MLQVGHYKSRTRLVLVSLFLVLLYLLVQQPEIRSLYAAWDKWFHAGVFLLVWGLMRWCWASPPWFTSLACLLLGLLVEWHQFYLPGFDASFADWLSDAAGIFTAHVLYRFYSHAFDLNP